jgi:DNA-binding response OmpR family regulator
MITVDESKIQKDESIQIASKTKAIIAGKLSYDLDKCQLKYGNKTETITPESREIKFLRSLHNRAGMVVKYKDIARDANLQGYKYYHENCGESHEEINNQALSDDVAMLRRDFRSLVLSLGMPDSEFKRLITNVTKRGYMLNL